MPTYEFRCPQGHEFEKLYRTISGAEAQALCPQCGLPAERVMSATGFAFKGSGFYLTDYGKNAHRDKGTPEPKSGAPAGEGAASDGSRSEPKADTAPAGGASSAPAAETKKSESKSESKKSEPKGEPKPVATPAKKSSGE
jgi:putative FmdB family regulatory protein